MCTTKDIEEEIRRALNECVTIDGDDCGCNARYPDVLSAINNAIAGVAALRPDLFTENIEINIEAGKCRFNLCEAGCDYFIKYAYSAGDECFIPDKVDETEIGQSIEAGINPCFEFSSTAIEDSTVFQYSFDPKTPCELIVDREDTSQEVNGTIICGVIPDPFEDGDELPESVCKRLRSVIVHSAIYHLIQRDHKPSREFIEFAAQHRDSAAIALRDINTADGMVYGCNYLGVDTNDCD